MTRTRRTRIRKTRMTLPTDHPRVLGSSPQLQAWERFLNKTNDVSTVETDRRTFDQ